MEKDKIINLGHKEMTDEEMYQELKKNKNKEFIMGAEEWKKKRLKELKREGKLWSK